MSEQHNQVAVQATEVKVKAVKKQTKTKKAKESVPAATADNKMTYIDMALHAIKQLKQKGKGGVSKQAILKHLIVERKLDEKHANQYLNQALRKGVQSGVLRNVKGKGASGSFAIGEAVPKAKKPRAKKTAESAPSKPKEQPKKKTVTKKAATAKTKSAPKESKQAKKPKQSKVKSAAPA